MRSLSLPQSFLLTQHRQSTFVYTPSLRSYYIAQNYRLLGVHIATSSRARHIVVSTPTVKAVG